MRAVQLAKHFAEHIAEVIVVVDIGQEALVILTITFPVHAMDVLYIEFVLDLLPDVVEDVFPFLIGTVVEVGLEVDRFGFPFRQVNLLDALACTQAEVLLVLVGEHGGVTHVFEDDFGLVLTQVVFP